MSGVLRDPCNAAVVTLVYFSALGRRLAPSYAKKSRDREMRCSAAKGAEMRRVAEVVAAKRREELNSPRRRIL